MAQSPDGSMKYFKVCMLTCVSLLHSGSQRNASTNNVQWLFLMTRMFKSYELQWRKMVLSEEVQQVFTVA